MKSEPQRLNHMVICVYFWGLSFKRSIQRFKPQLCCLDNDRSIPFAWRIPEFWLGHPPTHHACQSNHIFSLKKKRITILCPKPCWVPYWAVSLSSWPFSTNVSSFSTILPRSPPFKCILKTMPCFSSWLDYIGGISSLMAKIRCIKSCHFPLIFRHWNGI